MKKENHILQLSLSRLVAGFKLLFLFLPITAMALLLGCASQSSVELPPEAKIKLEVARLSKQLEATGARVNQTGQTIRIIFASDRMFNPHSANLTSSAKTTLGVLSQLLRILETTSVEVKAYTNVEPNPIQNKALSTRQAEVVVDALWSKGVDARLIYAVGAGAQPALGLPTSLPGAADRRVEVGFQYLPLLSNSLN